MEKRIGFRDFSVRASDTSRHDAMCCVHRLNVCLAWLKLLSGLVLLVILAVPLVAQTNAATPDVGNTLFEIPSRQYLFGDWGGKRSKLAEKGVTFDFFYISDLEANPSGGMQQTQAGWPRIRGTIDINLDRLIERAQLSHHWTLAIRSQPGSKDWDAGESQ
jgi:carbohydrate-selective porin OprB